MKILNDLNMKYVVPNHGGNEEIVGGAILECSRAWTKEQLEKWLPDYDFDMIETVKNWLSNDAEIAEGGFLKVWTD